MKNSVLQRFGRPVVCVVLVTAMASVPGRSDGAVRAWPQPKEMARSADFALTAGGRSVDVLATAKPQKRILEHLRHPYSFAMFESDGSVEVEVTRLGTNVTWRDAVELSTVAEKMGRSANSLSMVLRSLIRKGVVHSPRLGTVAYTVPLFGDYMKRVS